MKIEGLQSFGNINLGKTITKPMQKAICKNVTIPAGLSAAALSGAYIANKSLQENESEEFFLGDTPFHNFIKDNQGERRFDMNAVDFMSKNLKNGENFIRTNIDNIKEISYTPASEETKNRDVFKLLFKDGSYEFEFKTIGSLKMEFSQIMRKPNGIKTVFKRERIGGTAKWKTTSTIFSKDNKKRTNNYETDIAYDTLGILHKTKVEQKFDKNENLIEQKVTKLDGNNQYLTVEYNNKNQKVSQLRTEYTKEGEIKSQTKFSYEYPANSEPVRKTETIDYKNFTKTTTIATGKNFRNLEKEIREFTNPKTGKVSKEILEKSDVMGVFNIKIIDENGKENIESLATKDLLGNVSIEKHLQSFDGTKTEYSYKATKNNNDVKVNYQIIDKNGKVLTTVDREFHKINDNSIISSLNGYKHCINYCDNGITINDLMTGDIKSVLYKDLLINNKQINKENIDFIKRMSADMILNLVNKSIKLNILDDMNGSNMNYNKKVLTTQRNMRTFSHESGHSIDYYDNNGNVRKLKLKINSDVRKVYEEEKSEFLKHFGDIEQKYVDYFINGIDGYNGIDSGIGETIAEINSMFSTEHTNNPDLYSRFHYLQKYFPKTVAILSTQLNPHSNIAFTGNKIV